MVMLFLPLHDGEGGIDVTHVVAVGDAVEMEEEEAYISKYLRTRRQVQPVSSSQDSN